jgi:hypothetical protein
MKRLTALLCLIVLLPSLTAYGSTFKDIRYNGGRLQTKVDPHDWGNTLTVTSDEIRLDLKDGQSLKIDPKKVTSLSYGQEAHRRVGTMIALGILVAPLALFGLFHKTRLHFVGIEYNTEDGKKAGVLLQAHKDNYRGVLEALRGATGAPVAVAPEDRKYVPTSVATITVENPDKPEKTAESDKGERPRKFEAEKDEVKAEVKPGVSADATGIVRVSSVPDGADVYVDGSFVGNAPAQLKLTVGKHKVAVKAEGLEDWSREIEVPAGSELNLKATLNKKASDH